MILVSIVCSPAIGFAITGLKDYLCQSYSKILCKSTEKKVCHIRPILTEHNVHFETDESVYALLTKLHGYYCSHIPPADTVDRIKPLLLSTGEVMDTINESRNSITLAHPDGQLIEKREAQLAIGLANSIVDYIEDIEAFTLS